MQHDLFPSAPFDLTPEPGRDGPRLWVRKLVVWSERGKAVRTVDLRPGLNVIWSPDAGIGSSDPIGHGGGKTTFCRLLRFCLGEATFSPSEQRDRIVQNFPDGMVGAEVIVDGVCWAIVRYFGRRDPIVVAEASSLDDAFSDGTAKTDLHAFKRHIAERILREAGELMPASIDAAQRWEAVLAWMTRDQECRLRHHFEWRDPDTDSRSPISIRRPKDDILAIVRASIRALSTAEIEARVTEEQQAAKLNELRAELGRLQWQMARAGTVLKRLYQVDGSSGLDTQVELLAIKSVAEDQARSALALPKEAATELEPARRARERAETRFREAERQQVENDFNIGLTKREISLIEGELAKASAVKDRYNNPVCPLCKVPLDTALAEGCNLATECDLDELKLREERTEADLDAKELQLLRLQSKMEPLKQEIALAQQALDRAKETVLRLEAASDARSRALRETNRAADEIERHEATVRERDETAVAIADLEDKLAQTKQKIADLLNSEAAVIRDLSAKFDGVVRALVPGKLSASASLDRKSGLALRIDYGGNRSTAAIESWKIVAFDLAVLAMTLEGKASLPGFLLHDSPREADLGMSLYERLFTFARHLEEYGPSPLFQYIVTTTTEPPEDFRQEPWLKLKLKGAPADERFLRVDL